jgi:hypothetical protein
MDRPTVAVVVALSSGLAACGAGPYGYSRTYAPLDAEQTAAEGATEYDPVMAKREPDAWHVKKISLFGVVLRREDRAGKGYLTLSVRGLEQRNVCETNQEDSCRTTVSDREYDKIHASVAFATPADQAGEESLGVGSLVRVIGKLGAPDAADGVQVLDAAYYRHWPRGYFRTTAARDVLRR